MKHARLIAAAGAAIIASASPLLVGVPAASAAVVASGTTTLSNGCSFSWTLAEDRDSGGAYVDVHLVSDAWRFDFIEKATGGMRWIKHRLLTEEHEYFDALVSNNERTLDAVGISGHSPVAPRIAAAESATWAAFARTGVPGNQAIPHWPAYTAADRTTMLIDTEWRVQKDPHPEARLLWTKIAVA